MSAHPRLYEKANNSVDIFMQGNKWVILKRRNEPITSILVTKSLTSLLITDVNENATSFHIRSEENFLVKS